VNNDREQIWRPTLGYDTTGKIRNILQKIFRILPVVDFLHSAFRILPLPRWPQFSDTWMYYELDPPLLIIYNSSNIHLIETQHVEVGKVVLNDEDFPTL